MRTKNSTNVRLELALLRAGFRVLGKLAPDFAAAQAEKLFRTPPPRPVSEIEEQVLAQAKSFSLSTQEGFLATYHWGKGPRVLLVHGWGGSAGQLHPLVGPLVEAGFSVLAFDAPGHGNSSGSLSSLPEFSEALTRVADWAGPLHGILTHSMGGAAASMALAAGLKTERWVCIAPPADAYSWFLKFSDHLGFSKSLEERTRHRIEGHFHIDFSRLNAGVLGPQIETPLLILHDLEDKEVAWEEARRIEESSPQGRLVTTVGLGHRRILKNPEVIATALAFLRGEDTVSLPSPPGIQCEGCGVRLEAARRGRQCAACELDFELFHPATRWAQSKNLS